MYTCRWENTASVVASKTPEKGWQSMHVHLHRHNIRNWCWEERNDLVAGRGFCTGGVRVITTVAYDASPPNLIFVICFYTVVDALAHNLSSCKTSWKPSWLRSSSTMPAWSDYPQKQTTLALARTRCTCNTASNHRSLSSMHLTSRFHIDALLQMKLLQSEIFTNTAPFILP